MSKTIRACRKCGSRSFGFKQTFVSRACIDDANPRALIVSRPSDGEDEVFCAECGEAYYTDDFHYVHFL